MTKSADQSGKLIWSGILRNTGDNRSFDLTFSRTTQSSDASDPRMEAVRELIRMENASTNLGKDRLDLYADHVDYFGKPGLNKSMIAVDMAIYKMRWNNGRHYEIGSEIVVTKIRPDTYRARCLVDFEVDGRGYRRKGTVLNNTEVTFFNQVPLITKMGGESAEILGRHAQR